MNLQNLETVFALGQSNIDMAVKAPRAKESFVEHVNAIRRGNNNNARFVIETVHFDKNLV